MKADNSENFENTDEGMINGNNRHHIITLILTTKWIHSDFFTYFQGLLNIFLFDTLNAKIGEGSCHGINTYPHSTDSFLTPFFPHQVVGVSTVRGILGYA
jgi:hypothetical protein